MLQVPGGFREEPGGAWGRGFPRAQGPALAAASPGRQLAHRTRTQSQGPMAGPDSAVAIGSLGPKHPQRQAETLNL